jgi:hypothetical protein
MNGHSTDYLYSSLPEEEGEEDDDDDDDNLLAHGKGTQSKIFLFFLKLHITVCNFFFISVRKRKKKNQKTNSKYLKDNHSELRRRLFQKGIIFV